MDSLRERKKGGSDDAQEVAAHAAAAAADVSAPSLPNGNGNGNGNGSSQHRLDSLFITAQNDWAPVHQKIVRAGTGGSKRSERRRHKRVKSTRPGRRTTDETREGYLYNILKWPFLLFVGCWVIGLALAYVLTRYYVWFYEYFISWRGRREQLRRNVRATSTYKEWKAAAKELDEYFGNSEWKEKNEFAYYDWKTVKKVWESMKKSREMAEKVEKRLGEGKMIGNEERQDGEKAVEALRALLTACVKNNFVGVENPRLYSQTYYGTKNLVQNHVDEGMLRCRSRTCF
jgi:ribosome biogenesis protein Nip4